MDNTFACCWQQEKSVKRKKMKKQVSIKMDLEVYLERGALSSRWIGNQSQKLHSSWCEFGLFLKITEIEAAGEQICGRGPTGVLISASRTSECLWGQWHGKCGNHQT